MDESRSALTLELDEARLTFERTGDVPQAFTHLSLLDAALSPDAALDAGAAVLVAPTDRLISGA